MTYAMQNNLQIEFRGYTDSKRHSHSNERNRTDRLLVKQTKEIPYIWTELCINSSNVGSNCHLNRWKFCVWVWFDVSSDGVFFSFILKIYSSKNFVSNLPFGQHLMPFSVYLYLLSVLILMNRLIRLVYNISGEYFSNVQPSECARKISVRQVRHRALEMDFISI